MISSRCQSRSRTGRSARSRLPPRWHQILCTAFRQRRISNCQLSLSAPSYFPSQCQNFQPLRPCCSRPKPFLRRPARGVFRTGPAEVVVCNHRAARGEDAAPNGLRAASQAGVPRYRDEPTVSIGNNKAILGIDIRVIAVVVCEQGTVDFFIGLKTVAIDPAGRDSFHSRVANSEVLALGPDSVTRSTPSMLPGSPEQSKEIVILLPIVPSPMLFPLVGPNTNCSAVCLPQTYSVSPGFTRPAVSVAANRDVPWNAANPFHALA